MLKFDELSVGMDVLLRRTPNDPLTHGKILQKTDTQVRLLRSDTQRSVHILARTWATTWARHARAADPAALSAPTLTATAAPVSYDAPVADAPVPSTDGRFSQLAAQLNALDAQRTAHYTALVARLDRLVELSETQQRLLAEIVTQLSQTHGV
jgi:hypothetical protein